MKKAMILLSLCSMLLTGCAKGNGQYMKAGNYYLDGTVITCDGNIWDYQTETISNEPAYDDAPVYVVFDDNGTETNIYDDIIIKLIIDVEAIYDEM